MPNINKILKKTPVPGLDNKPLYYLVSPEDWEHLTKYINKLKKTIKEN